MIRVTGLTNDVSYEDSGDPIARKHDHRVDSERVYDPCVSACAASARLNGQTSSRSPPTCICTVSRLYAYASVPLDVMISYTFYRMRDTHNDESYSFVFPVSYVFVSAVGLVNARDEMMRLVVHCVEEDHEELVRDDRVDQQP